MDNHFRFQLRAAYANAAVFVPRFYALFHTPRRHRTKHMSRGTIHFNCRADTAAKASMVTQIIATIQASGREAD